MVDPLSPVSAGLSLPSGIVPSTIQDTNPIRTSTAPNRSRTVGTGSLPPGIAKEVDSRLAEVRRLLSAIEPDVRGTLNRYRYRTTLRCMEEVVEALALRHYVMTQTLASPEEVARVLLPPERLTSADTTSAATDVKMADADAATTTTAVTAELHTIDASDASGWVLLTHEDYLFGIFDLFGEMMRLATTTAGRNGGRLVGGGDGGGASSRSSNIRQQESREAADAITGGSTSTTTGCRNILDDIQELWSHVEMLPPCGPAKAYAIKVDTMRTSVQKVERLGYGLAVRGGERPGGWVPDDGDEGPPADDG